jgi:hypothetical protein
MAEEYKNYLNKKMEKFNMLTEMPESDVIYKINFGLLEKIKIINKLDIDINRLRKWIGEKEEVQIHNRKDGMVEVYPVGKWTEMVPGTWIPEETLTRIN